MTDYIYNEVIYQLSDGNAVTSKVAERYFTRFLTDYVGKLGSPAFVKLDNEIEQGCFYLYFDREADSCGDCDEAGITVGRCEHEWVEQIYYKAIDLYLD
jgi:hypothetical protein